MVYYFVIGGDNQRYGPADIDTLVLWAREGRLVGSTTLIERGTERAVRADSITAINVEIQRLSGDAPAVAVERGADFPTMTGVGTPGSGFPPQAQGPQAFPGRPPNLPPIPTLPYAGRPVGRRSRLAAGLLGIFLGSLGVHRFYLGYTGIGILQLLLTVMTCSGFYGLAGIWGFVEGVICLCGGMRDADGMELRD